MTRVAQRSTAWLLVLTGLGASSFGCTAESTRVAIEAQRRADDVQQAVFERQHEGLLLLLYRDVIRRIEDARSSGSRAQLTDAQRAALNEAWNQRDLIEFWAVQHERARALRLAGVDAKLFADQSIVDLLIKLMGAKGQRMKQGLAAAVGGALAEEVAQEQNP